MSIVITIVLFVRMKPEPLWINTAAQKLSNGTVRLRGVNGTRNNTKAPSLPNGKKQLKKSANIAVSHIALPFLWQTVLVSVPTTVKLNTDE